MSVRVTTTDGHNTLLYRGKCWIEGNQKLYFKLRCCTNNEHAFFVFNIKYNGRNGKGQWKPVLIGAFAASDTNDEPYSGDYMMSFKRLKQDDVAAYLAA